VSNDRHVHHGRWWTLTDGRSQVRLTAALAVRTATWLRDEEAHACVDHKWTKHRIGS